MTNRTARGTASSKTSGTTLTIPSFTVPAGHALVVGGAYDNSQLAPLTVTHAGRTLRRRQQQNNSARSIHASMWLKGEYHNEQTGTCVLTWGGAIGERAAFATSLDLALRKDDGASNQETTSVTNPATGSTGSLVTAGAFVVGTRHEIVSAGTTDFTLIGAADSSVGTLFVATGVGSGTGTAREALTSQVAFAIGVFGSEGPVEDSAGAAQIRNNGSLTSATLGQRAGTTGGAAATNITVQETFLQLSTQHFTRGVLNSATSRRWVNCILALEPRLPRHKLAISPTDFQDVEDIVDTAGGDPNDVYYGFDEDGNIVAYETTTPGTLRATWNPDVGAWVAA